LLRSIVHSAIFAATFFLRPGRSSAYYLPCKLNSNILNAVLAISADETDSRLAQSIVLAP